MNIQLSNSCTTGQYNLRSPAVYSVARPARYLPTKDDYAANFYRHLRLWRFHTMFASSVEVAISHPSFREIVGMGEKVVPLIISEISGKPDLLIIALQLITGADPVQERNRGRMAEMASDWIDWFRRKG